MSYPRALLKGLSGEAEGSTDHCRSIVVDGPYNGDSNCKLTKLGHVLDIYL